MERRRRVARIGQYESKKNSPVENDLVTGVLEKMDQLKSSSANQELYNIYKVADCESNSIPCNSEMPSVNSTPVMSSSQKKFIGSKRHLLMEKAQKNIKYIKHNRNLPKPRAHLGRLKSIDQQKKESPLVRNSSPVKLKRGVCTSKKVVPKNPSFHEESLSGRRNTISTESTLSDTESEFESFIQSQKQHMDDMHMSSSVKRKKKSKKNNKKLKITSSKKKKISSRDLKSMELKSSDDEAPVRCLRKQERSKISINVTSANKLLLPETSESSDESSNENKIDCPEVSQKQHVADIHMSSSVKMKSKENNKKSKIASSKKEKISSRDLKSMELKSSDDESPVRCLRKHKSSKISCNVTSANQVLLPETNESSDEPSNGTKIDSPKVNPVTSVPSAEKENKCEVETKICFVRIERNQDLETKVSQIGLQLHKSDSQNEEVSLKLSEKMEPDALGEAVLNSDDDCVVLCDSQNEKVCPKLSSEKMEPNAEDEAVLNSDDECVVVYEVPKSDNCPTKCLANESDGSEIQILNIVSLKECDENVAKLEVPVSNTPSALMGNINFDNLKQALENAQFLENSSNNSTYDAVTRTDNLANSTNRNVDKENSPVPTDIMRTISEIDFKKILSFTKEGSNNDSLPCKSSSEEMSTFARLSAPTTADHLRNMMETVNVNRLLPEQVHNGAGFSKHNAGNCNSKEIDKNIAGDTFMPLRASSSTNNLNLSTSDLKDILLNVEKLENTFQSQPTSNNQVKNHDVEDPLEELDAITTAAINHPNCDDKNKQIILSLLDELIKIDKLYLEIKSSGGLTEASNGGLLLLQTLQANKQRHLVTVIENILKRDPCVYRVLDRSGPTVLDPNSLTNSIENSENRSNSLFELSKVCVKCGLQATIDCARCKKVYFCSESCGVYYWNNFHYKECDGL